MKKTNRMATIYDGHTHIERRVFEDDYFNWYVKINGLYWKINELNFKIDTWISE